MINDAVNAVSNGMSLDDIIKITGDESLSKEIHDLTKDVNRYSYFKIATDLGIVFGPQDLSFTDMLLFSWIANRKK